MDVAIASVALLLLLPVFIALWCLVRLNLGSPAFFRQPRAGKGGVPFCMVKFRSMRDMADENGTPYPDDQRLTRFGEWLRSTSLDELPEFWNVLRGEMSVVGPRPLLPEYTAIYAPEQARRLEVRPGITGWAQVNGRNNLTWPEKFALDVWYVDNQSIALDIKILMMTILKVLRRDGISEPGSATAQRFKGEI